MTTRSRTGLRLVATAASAAILTWPALADGIQSANPMSAKKWKVEASISGGLPDAVTRVSVTADGQLTMDSPRLGLHCKQPLEDVDLRALDTAIAKVRPESWARKYALAHDPAGEEFRMSLRLEQLDSRGRPTTRSTVWDMDSDSLVAADVHQLFVATYAARRVCLTTGNAGK